jgi:hypothetical protein
MLPGGGIHIQDLLWVVFTRFKMTAQVDAMIAGALAGSARGLMHRGDELRHAAPGAGEKPTGGHNFHPELAWSSILEPAFVAAETLIAAPGIYEMHGAGRTPASHDMQQFTSKFASRMVTWQQGGFREWRDPSTPYRVNPQVAATMRQDTYAGSPIRTAAGTPINRYDCEPLAYALIAAVAPSADIAINLTIALAAASVRSGREEAILTSAILQVVLHRGRVPEMTAAIRAARARISPDMWKILRDAMERAAGEHPLRETGGRDHGGIASASFQVFFWIVGRYLNGDMPSWSDAIGKVCQQGGAADINCALVGAVLGAAGGHDSLPDWCGDINHVDWAIGRFRAVLSPDSA